LFREANSVSLLNAFCSEHRMGMAGTNMPSCQPLSAILGQCRVRVAGGGIGTAVGRESEATDDTLPSSRRMIV